MTEPKPNLSKTTNLIKLRTRSWSNMKNISKPSWISLRQN